MNIENFILESWNNMKIIDGKDYLEEVKGLIIEYTKWLNRDLSFQNIDEELQNIEKKYTAPAGELLVAIDDDNTVMAMVAYHRHTSKRCEMKRLYVKTDYRGIKLGEQLVQAILKHAKMAGYREMVLDTIVPLQSAIHLYQKYGFQECEPYYDNPMDDVIYMKRDL